MAHRLALRAWLIAVAALALTARAVGADSSRRSVLADVKALDRPVSYSETKIPLGELVQKIAGDIGARLTAAPAVADEPVAVVVKDLPARDLLEQLADLLDYQWHRRLTHPTPNTEHPIPTLEIWQDLASRQREEAPRDAEFAAAEKRLQEEVRLAVEMASLSTETIMALRDEQQRRARELNKLPPEEAQARLNTPEEQEKSRRYQLTTYLWSPISRSIASLLGRLTPEQWTRLQEDGQIQFSTEPRPGELPLPAEMACTLRAATPSLNRPGEHFIFPNEIGGEERLYQQEKAMQERWTGAAGYHVTIQLDTSRLQSEGSLHLSAQASPIDPGPPPRSYTISSGMALNLDVGPADLSQDLPEADTPQRRAALEKDPLLGARKPFKPEAKLRMNPFIRVPEYAGTRQIQDLLPDLARTYGASFIADAYWSAPAVPPGLPRADEPIAPFTLLDRLARPSHRWDRSGSLIRLRSRKWFLDRPAEVPLRFVRRWSQLLEQYAALPLDSYVEMAMALRDEQLASLPRIIEAGALPHQLPDLQMVYPARQALRLYASLSPAQQQALWQGTPLPIEQMTPAQRALLLAAVKETDRYRSVALDLSQPAAVSLLMTGLRYVRVQEKRGSVFNYSREDAAPAGTAGNPAPRAPDRVPAPASSMPRTASSPPAGLTPQPRSPGSPSVAITRHPVTRVWFYAQRGPERREIGSITISSPS